MDIKDVKIGSIIKRRICGVLWHMGIYVGDYKVIHFHSQNKSERKKNAKVRCDTLEYFSDNHPIYLHKEPINECHGKDICRLAGYFLDYPEEFDGKYNASKLNCEDFVIRCFGSKYYNSITQRAKCAIAVSAIAITGFMKWRKKYGNKRMG